MWGDPLRFVSTKDKRPFSQEFTLSFGASRLSLFADTR
jgi:hypothetical protein